MQTMDSFQYSRYRQDANTTPTEVFFEILAFGSLIATQTLDIYHHSMIRMQLDALLA